MQKKYIYSIILIVFILGIFAGHSGNKGEITTIKSNLDSAESRASSLENSVSNYINTITDLESQLETERKRYREQAAFIDKITEGFTSSGKTIDNIENGNIRGQEIVQDLLDKI